MEKFVSSTFIPKYEFDELLAYQKLLLDRITDPGFNERRIYISRPHGKSFYGMYNKLERNEESERIEFNTLTSQYYIDPEILAEINTKELIKEMEKNDVLNNRRNQKPSSRINRRSY